VIAAIRASDAVCASAAAASLSDTPFRLLLAIFTAIEGCSFLSIAAFAAAGHFSFQIAPLFISPLTLFFAIDTPLIRDYADYDYEPFHNSYATLAILLY